MLSAPGRVEPRHHYREPGTAEAVHVRRRSSRAAEWERCTARPTPSSSGRSPSSCSRSGTRATEDARARFRREALAAARLSGRRNVVTVFDVGEHGAQPLIVMEYLEGGSVFDRLREGECPPGLALEWLDQTAQALDRAHAEGSSIAT